MVSGRYLAMHPAEIAGTDALPEKPGWMVCPGSRQWQSPPALPRDSLLILTDKLPPEQSCTPEQLCQAVTAMYFAGVILDFQRPAAADTRAFASRLVSTLPCPVAVSEHFAEGLNCPVFLSPCPHHVPLQAHLSPWAGREIWLDLAPDAETITLTKDGASILPVPLEDRPSASHRDDRLFCHYTIETGADFARFTLWRTREDVDSLQLAAETVGIQTFVGLWQELRM